VAKVKICGITNSEDAKASVDAGCDALGFVFYKKSPRYIAPVKARGIIRQLGRRVIKIGVFFNAREKTIRRAVKLCGLDMLQFHGRESPEFCARFDGCKIIKVFRIKGSAAPENLSRYKTSAYLFDTFVKSKAGGTGRKFDWKLLSRINNKISCPVFLSGGLNEKNVREAVRSARPDWVDASSSLEIKPGKKDPKKVREFIKAAGERA